LEEIYTEAVLGGKITGPVPHHRLHSVQDYCTNVRSNQVSKIWGLYNIWGLVPQPCPRTVAELFTPLLD